MKKIICGSEMDRMPNWAFKGMAFLFNIADKFKTPDRKLDPFDIKNGQTVIDYGCGTGRYLKPASELVGGTGTVYAVDIHELAIESAFHQIDKHNLKNIKPIQTDGKTVNIPSQVADLIYCDRCLLYSFRCAVYYAQTEEELREPEKLKWWNWKDKRIT
jgi:SAM-dependent methyltransferase